MADRAKRVANAGEFSNVTLDTRRMTWGHDLSVEWSNDLSCDVRLLMARGAAFKMTFAIVVKRRQSLSGFCIHGPVLRAWSMFQMALSALPLPGFCASCRNVTQIALGSRRVFPVGGSKHAPCVTDAAAHQTSHAAQLM